MSQIYNFSSSVITGGFKYNSGVRISWSNNDVLMQTSKTYCKNVIRGLVLFAEENCQRYLYFLYLTFFSTFLYLHFILLSIQILHFLIFFMKFWGIDTFCFDILFEVLVTLFLMIILSSKLSWHFSFSHVIFGVGFFASFFYNVLWILFFIIISLFNCLYRSFWILLIFSFFFLQKNL